MELRINEPERFVKLVDIESGMLFEFDGFNYLRVRGGAVSLNVNSDAWHFYSNEVFTKDAEFIIKGEVEIVL